MLKDSPAFSGFSVDNLEKAQQFYGEVLGLEVEKTAMGLQLKTGGGSVFVYQKDDHSPATYTILNFPVDDIKAAVTELASKGVIFERYPDMTDEDGIAWGSKYDRGPDIAWFRDPAGNFLSILNATAL